MQITNYISYIPKDTILKGLFLDNHISCELIVCKNDYPRSEQSIKTGFQFWSAILLMKARNVN
jgi:hypothetical protein